MSLGKQAKLLTNGQIDAVVSYLAKTRHPTRNRLVFLLSIRARLRAREIALLTWSMVTDAEGKVGRAIALRDRAASKGRSGRIVPLHSQLRAALIEWYGLHRHPTVPNHSHRAVKQTSPQVVVNMFARWYEQIGFDGCSSHSGRRTFIRMQRERSPSWVAHSGTCRCWPAIRACASPSDTSTLTKTPNGRSSS